MMLIGVVIAIVALVGGCGGDDDEPAADGQAGVQGAQQQEGSQGEGGESDGESGDGSTEESSPAKQAFLKEADAACRRVHGDLANEAAAYLAQETRHGTPRPVAMANFGRTVMAPTIEAEIAKLRELEPPAGDEEQIEAILEAEEEEVEELKALDEAKAAFKLIALFEESTEMFREYGFKACANGP